MVHIISPVTLAALSAAALLAACPSACRMGVLHPPSQRSYTNQAVGRAAPQSAH